VAAIFRTVALGTVEGEKKLQAKGCCKSETLPQDKSTTCIAHVQTRNKFTFRVAKRCLPCHDHPHGVGGTACHPSRHQCFVTFVAAELWNRGACNNMNITMREAQQIERQIGPISLLRFVGGQGLDRVCWQPLYRVYTLQVGLSHLGLVMAMQEELCKGRTGVSYAKRNRT
jgi:hypothetical protein